MIERIFKAVPPIERAARCFLRYKLHKQALHQFETPSIFYKYLENCSVEIDFQFKEEQPIFLLSAGWRSGSTLLQRLISSCPDTVIWGEPYDRSNLIQHLSYSLLAISSLWPPSQYYFKKDKARTDAWIANQYPPLEYLLQSHRSLLRKLFIESANDAGFSNWGIKEVRYGTKEILYLKLFFPNAVFIFLTRAADDAFISYSNFSKNKHWYDMWPTQPISNSYRFARHHAQICEDFKECARLVNALELSYESLISDPKEVKRLEEHCSKKFNPDILKAKIGSSAETNRKNNTLTSLDRALIFAGIKFEKLKRRRK